MLRSRPVLRLCQTIPKRVGLVRFQSMAAQGTETIQNVAKTETSKVEQTLKDAPKAGSKAPFVPKNNRRPYNRKLGDISRQITVSISDADPASLTEAVDIFEEGITYLREIQHSEGIDEEHMYRLFQRSSTALLEKAIEGANESIISRVLDICCTNRIAHLFHFTMYQQYLLQQGPTRQAEVLSLWLRYLEYSKSLDPPLSYISNKLIGCHVDSKFLPSDMLNLTYFAYVMQCSAAGVEQNINDIVKLLQLSDTSRVPNPRQVRASVSKMGLADTLASEMNSFNELTRSTFIKTLDPNGESMANKIFSISKKGSANQLRQFYDQMIAASVENKLPLTEDTLTRVMSAFIEFHQFNDALAVFSTMMRAFKPSDAAWAMALKAMGHPKNVETLSDDQKNKTVETIKSSIASMEASGVAVNARILAVAVGAMANMGKQDEIKQLMNKYNKIPVVHLTRHNILLGLILNQNVSEAEQLMKQYFKEDPTYIPLVQLLNGFLSHYVAVGNDAAADAMMKFMSDKGISADLGTITTVVNYYFKTCKNNGQIPDVKTVLSEIGRAEIKWDANMASTLLSGMALDDTGLEAARSVFKYFTELGPQYKNSPAMYTPMIKAELDFGNTPLALDLFEWYDQNLRSEVRMWNMMIAGLLTKNEARAIKLYQQMKERSVEPNYFTYYFMINHFIKTGNAKRVQWVIDELAASRLNNFGQVLPSRILQLRLKYNVDQGLLERLNPK